eukprot:6320731-Prymnesium_polylepis.2
MTPSATSELNGRTLQGFATSSTTSAKMYVHSASCPGCPYRDFLHFYEYYGDLDYADKWVTGALDGTKVTFTSGKEVDFATVNDDNTRTQCAKKGSAVRCPPWSELSHATRP